MENENQNWYDELDARQQTEVRFAREYAKHYSHGTDGHHRLLLIARMADLLDLRQAALNTANEELERLGDEALDASLERDRGD